MEATSNPMNLSMDLLSLTNVHELRWSYYQLQIPNIGSNFGELPLQLQETCGNLVHNMIPFVIRTKYDFLTDASISNLTYNVICFFHDKISDIVKRCIHCDFKDIFHGGFYDEIFNPDLLRYCLVKSYKFLVQRKLLEHNFFPMNDLNEHTNSCVHLSSKDIQPFTLFWNLTDSLRDSIVLSYHFGITPISSTFEVPFSYLNSHHQKMVLSCLLSVNVFGINANLVLTGKVICSNQISASEFKSFIESRSCRFRPPPSDWINHVMQEISRPEVSKESEIVFVNVAFRDVGNSFKFLKHSSFLSTENNTWEPSCLVLVALDKIKNMQTEEEFSQNSSCSLPPIPIENSFRKPFESIQPIILCSEENSNSNCSYLEHMSFSNFKKSRLKLRNGSFPSSMSQISEKIGNQILYELQTLLLLSSKCVVDSIKSKDNGYVDSCEFPQTCGFSEISSSWHQEISTPSSISILKHFHSNSFKDDPTSALRKIFRNSTKNCFTSNKLNQQENFALNDLFSSLESLPHSLKTLHSLSMGTPKYTKNLKQNPPNTLLSIKNNNNNFPVVQKFPVVIGTMANFSLCSYIDQLNNDNKVDALFNSQKTLQSTVPNESSCSQNGQYLSQECTQIFLNILNSREDNQKFTLKFNNSELSTTQNTLVISSITNHQTCSVLTDLISKWIPNLPKIKDNFTKLYHLDCGSENFNQEPDDLPSKTMSILHKKTVSFKIKRRRSSGEDATQIKRANLDIRNEWVCECRNVASFKPIPSEECVIQNNFNKKHKSTLEVFIAYSHEISLSNNTLKSFIQSFSSYFYEKSDVICNFSISHTKFQSRVLSQPIFGNSSTKSEFSDSNNSQKLFSSEDFNNSPCFIWNSHSSTLPNHQIINQQHSSSQSILILLNSEMNTQHQPSQINLKSDLKCLHLKDEQSKQYLASLGFNPVSYLMACSIPFQYVSQGKIHLTYHRMVILQIHKWFQQLNDPLEHNFPSMDTFENSSNPSRNITAFLNHPDLTTTKIAREMNHTNLYYFPRLKSDIQINNNMMWGNPSKYISKLAFRSQCDSLIPFSWDHLYLHHTLDDFYVHYFIVPDKLNINSFFLNIFYRKNLGKLHLYVKKVDFLHSKVDLYSLERAIQAAFFWELISLCRKNSSSVLNASQCSFRIILIFDNRFFQTNPSKQLIDSFERYSTSESSNLLDFLAEIHFINVSSHSSILTHNTMIDSFFESRITENSPHPLESAFMHYDVKNLLQGSLLFRLPHASNTSTTQFSHNYDIFTFTLEESYSNVRRFLEAASETTQRDVMAKALRHSSLPVSNLISENSSRHPPPYFVYEIYQSIIKPSS